MKNDLLNLEHLICNACEILKESYLITVFHEYLAGIIFSEFVILEISQVFNLAIPKKVLFCCSLAYTPAHTHPAIAKYSIKTRHILYEAYLVGVLLG